MPVGEVNQTEEDMVTTMVVIITDRIRTVAVTHLRETIETGFHHLHRPMVEGQHGVKMIDQIPDCRPGPLSPFQIPCMMVDDRIVVATALNQEISTVLHPEEFRLP